MSDKRISTTEQLINNFGVEKLKDTWQKYGMYESARRLEDECDFYVSPYVMRYLSNKFEWKRVISDPNLPLVKGILNGKTSPEYYKHVTFENIPGIPGNTGKPSTE